MTDSIVSKARAAGHTYVCLCCFNSGNKKRCPCGFEATAINILEKCYESISRYETVINGVMGKRRNHACRQKRSLPLLR